MTALVRTVDEAVDSAWEHLRGRPVADRVFYAASALGDHSLVWHLLGGLRGLAPGHRTEEAVRLSATMGVESALVNGPVKSLFRRRRPAVDAGPHPHAVRTPLTSSFPSGHASAAFAAAAVLTDGAGMVARVAVYAAAGVISASRVHVRMHHASDVVAGALLGAGLGVAARRIWAVVPGPFGTGPAPRARTPVQG